MLESGDDYTKFVPVQGGETKETKPVAYVVTENCIKCKYTDCVDVCPVDCFREEHNS